MGASAIRNVLYKYCTVHPCTRVTDGDVYSLRIKNKIILGFQSFFIKLFRKSEIIKVWNLKKY